MLPDQPLPWVCWMSCAWFLFFMLPSGALRLPYSDWTFCSCMCHSLKAISSRFRFYLSVCSIYFTEHGITPLLCVFFRDQSLNFFTIDFCLYVCTQSMDKITKCFYDLKHRNDCPCGWCMPLGVASSLVTCVLYMHVVQLGLVKREWVLNSTSNLTGIKLCTVKKS